MQEPFFLNPGDAFAPEKYGPTDILVYLGYLTLAEYTAVATVTKPKVANLYVREEIQGHWFARLSGPVFLLERRSFSELKALTDLNGINHALCGEPRNQSGLGSGMFGTYKPNLAGLPENLRVRSPESDSMLLGVGWKRTYESVGSYRDRLLYEEHRVCADAPRYFDYNQNIIV